MGRSRWRVGLCLGALGLVLLACIGTAGDDDGPFFRDSFEDVQSGWGAQQGEYSERGYDEQDEAYFIALSEPEWFVWATPGVRLADVDVEVEAGVAEGAPSGHFGVLCRYRDADNFYYLAVSGDGYYGIFRRQDGDWEVLTADGAGMVASPAIKTGQATNRVRAVCRGEQLTLYANGELLEAVEDATHGRGGVGLGAGSDEDGGVRVEFDEYVVRQPQDEEESPDEDADD